MKTLIVCIALLFVTACASPDRVRIKQLGTWKAQVGLYYAF